MGLGCGAPFGDVCFGEMTSRNRDFCHLVLSETSSDLLLCARQSAREREKERDKVLGLSKLRLM